MNLKDGFSSHVITTIMRKHDREWARERVKQLKSEGEELRKKLTFLKSITAGQLIKAGEHRLGESLRDEKIQRNKEKEALEQEAKKQRSKLIRNTC